MTRAEAIERAKEHLGPPRSKRLPIEEVRYVSQVEVETHIALIRVATHYSDLRRCRVGLEGATSIPVATTTKTIHRLDTGQQWVLNRGNILNACHAATVTRCFQHQH